MDDLDRLILETYQQKLATLSPIELRSRLSRRNSPTFSRPPRTWCLAIRASDNRINNDTAIVIPYQAINQKNPDRHDILIDHKLLVHLCQPVHLKPGMDWTDVAKSLGVHPESLRHSMKSGRFRLHYYKRLGGKRGKPVPVFLNYETLDPSSGRLRQPTDPLWGQMWQYAAQRIPKDFEQTLTRHPVYLLYQGDPRFRGYKWQCPKCQTQTRILYCPLPPYNIPSYLQHDPAMQLNDSTLQSAIRNPQSAMEFACHHCHRIQYFSHIDRNSWNHFITHITAGLLYGHEVNKSKSFHAQENRKRKYRPSFNRPLSKRREQVKTLLLQGLTYDEIAKELKVGYCTVHQHVKHLYKQYGVHGREGLAKRQGHPVPLQPISKKRQAVEQLMGTGLAYNQIAQKLGTTYDAVHHHIRNIRSARKVKA